MTARLRPSPSSTSKSEGVPFARMLPGYRARTLAIILVSVKAALLLSIAVAKLRFMTRTLANDISERGTALPYRVTSPSVV